MTEENCRQFRLLTWTSFIGEFVLKVGRKGMRKRELMSGIVILASYKFHFIREL